MEGCKKLIKAAIILFVMMSISCSDDQNPGTSSSSGGDDVTITDISGGNMFWGDEMVINGTGFSTVKEENIVKLTGVSPSASLCPLNYTSDSGGDIEIVSATATQLKIKIPFRGSVSDDNSTVECGPEKANLEVTVKDKTATKEGLKFNALPWIGGFNYHYGWFDYPSVTRIGDSVMIEGGMKGYYARESGLWYDITLYIDGTPIEAKYRTIGLESGWAFYLSAVEYGEMNCSTEPDGWAAREMQFALTVAGKGVSKYLFVQYLPEQSVYCADCPATESKLNPDKTWRITGTNIYYTEIRFVPQTENCGTSQVMSLSKGKTFDDEITVQLPLSVLIDECVYSVFLVDPCNNSILIGDFTRE